MVGLIRTSTLAIFLAITLVAGGLTGCANQVPAPNAALGPDGQPVVPGTARDFSINVGNTDMVARCPASFRQPAGSEVALHVNPDHLHLFDRQGGQAL